MKTNGRPAFSEDIYKEWLEDMKPFLKIGESINATLRKSGLLSHSNNIYKK